MNLIIRKSKNIFILSDYVKALRHASNLTNRQAILHRALIFEQEQSRQLREIERVEKIEVKIIEPSHECTLVMNKNLSTPYNCALHLSELFAKRSALANLNNLIWDMHRPLESDCTLKFLHFKDKDPKDLNEAYWRSCSFLLGYLIETAFKENYYVDLCQSVPSNIESGSFAYDAKLNMTQKWNPSLDELRCLTLSASQIINKNINFERLRIKHDLAKEMFKYQKFKLQQIEESKKNAENETNDYVTVYRLGDFVDISNGPMIANTSIIGRFDITGVHNINSSKLEDVQRFQGISVPHQLKLHYWTYNLLAERASKLNKSKVSTN